MVPRYMISLYRLDMTVKWKPSSHFSTHPGIIWTPLSRKPPVWTSSENSTCRWWCQPANSFTVSTSELSFCLLVCHTHKISYFIIKLFTLPFTRWRPSGVHAGNILVHGLHNKSNYTIHFISWFFVSVMAQQIGPLCVGKPGRSFLTERLGTSRW